jgi:hypothetical protein
MRLLKVCFRNCKIFKKDIVIDFTNSNSVRKSPSEREHLLKGIQIEVRHLYTSFDSLYWVERNGENIYTGTSLRCYRCFVQKSELEFAKRTA